MIENLFFTIETNEDRDVCIRVMGDGNSPTSEKSIEDDGFK